MKELNIVCGDIHGKWGPLNTLINKRHPTRIFACGDFGWWPKMHGLPIHDWQSRAGLRPPRKFEDSYGVKAQGTKIYWCDGNHEDHDSLAELREHCINPPEVMDNVFYQPRGSTFTLPDGRVVLFIGGADSTDKELRTPGRDWFPEEIISQRDIYNLPNCDVDIVISHTNPDEFCKELFNRSQSEMFREKFEDPSRLALSVVLNKYRPKLWYFGHYHTYREGFWSGTNTKWYCLGMAPEMHWWVYLDD